MKIISLPAIIGAFIALSHGISAGVDPMPLENLLPDEINGWSTQGEDENFDRKTIFHYMNGAGEIYLAYDFQNMLVREYKKELAPSIIAEIYQMSSSEDAFGVFTFDMDGEKVNIGQDGVYSAGLLRFWKGNIFVRLFAEKETNESKDAVISLGEYIEGKIPSEGKKSALLDCLPAEGLLKDIHYFHKQIILNGVYYISDANLLNLSEKTEAVLARYQFGDDKVRFLIVKYHSPGEARKAYKQFIEAYFPEKPEAGSSMKIERLEDDKFTSVRRIRNFFVLIFDSPDKGICRQLTDDVVKGLKKVFVWMRKRDR